MKQRTAFLLAIVLTAFVAVLVLGVASATTLRAALPAGAAAMEAGPAAAAAATSNTAPAPVQGNSAAELVSFEGTPAYEISVANGTLYVDAASGDILYDSRAATAGESVLMAQRAGKDSSRQLVFDDDHEADHEEHDEHEEYEGDD